MISGENVTVGNWERKLLCDSVAVVGHEQYDVNRRIYGSNAVSIRCGSVVLCRLVIGVGRLRACQCCFG